MPWTIDFTQDTEAKGTGTATTNFDGDGADLGISFSMSTRLDTNEGASIDLFINEALATLEKHRSTRVEKNAVIDKLTIILNAKTA